MQKPRLVGIVCYFIIHGINACWAAGEDEIPDLTSTSGSLCSQQSSSSATSISAQPSPVPQNPSGAAPLTFLNEPNAASPRVSMTELDAWVHQGAIEPILTALRGERLRLPETGQARSLLATFMRNNPTHLLAHYFAGFFEAWNIWPPTTRTLALQGHIPLQFERIADQVTGIHGVIAALENAFYTMVDGDFLNTMVDGDFLNINNPTIRNVMERGFQLWGPLTQSWNNYLGDIQELPEEDPFYYAQQDLYQALIYQDELFSIDRLALPFFVRLCRPWMHLRSAAMAGYPPAVELYWRIVQAPDQPFQSTTTSAEPLIGPFPVPPQIVTWNGTGTNRINHNRARVVTREAGHPLRYRFINREDLRIHNMPWFDQI